MSNTSTEPAQLSPEIQKQLGTLNAKLGSTSEEVKSEIKQIISAFIVENITLKRENAQLKVDKSSKS